ncbi:MAG: DUF2341 domain-containing protein, partial [Candidatus Aenigmarchaeota archaeon]|nr:DUF2341 domain-containing protein [Candidatus Aenigmarchaeota archaeon]
FDGVDDYVNISNSNSLNITNEITLEVWVKDPPGVWWNSSWKYRKEIVIDYTKVNESQTNFPVLINITDADLSDGAKSNGDDIAFAGSTGTQLDHEIEFYNGTTGYLVAWVRMPTLSNETNTTLYMYYNNSGASNQQNVSGVWDSNFVMVQHLSETPGGTNTTYDSTSYGNNGTTSGMDSNDQVAGKIDGSLDFDSGDDYVDLGSIASGNSLMLNSSNVTISAWASKTSGGDTYQRIADKSTAGHAVDGYGMWIENQQIGISVGDSSWDTDSAVVISYSTLHHIVGIITASGFKVYVDGVEKAGAFYRGSAEQPPLAAANMRIAAWNTDTNRNWYGVLDEVRISNVARSAGWIKTSYNNQDSPSTFYAVGAEESVKKIIDKGEDIYALKTGMNGLILYGYINNQEISTTVTTPADWHHFILTYDGSNQKLYVDGLLGNTTSLSGAINTSSDGLTIGECFDGTIDEVRIHNRALTAEEINASYNAELHALYHNFTDIADGTYTYTAYAQNLAGNLGTGTRTLTIDTINPQIYFVSPTPTDKEYRNYGSAYINTTATDTNNITSFIDWNNSLVGWWRMNDEAGTVVEDFSGHGNNGTAISMNTGIDNGTSGWTTGGKFGNAMMFDGTNDYISISDSTNSVLDITSDITIETWVNFNSVPARAYEGLVTKDFAYILIMNDAGNGFISYLYDGASWIPSQNTNNLNLQPNTWYHIVMTYTSGDYKIYKNGVVASTDSDVLTIDTNDNSVRIGTDRLEANRYFNGTIDE